MENGNGALQIHKESSIVPAGNGWQTLKEQAAMLVKSGFLPPSVNTPEKVIAIVMTGKELGIGMMEAIRSINVIQGKPTVSPQLMLALANRTGKVEDQEIISTEEKCIVTIKRRGRKSYTNEFGVKEATEMGLIKKDNYIKQKKVMFQWRAIAANLRVTFSDAVSGLYTPEELGATVSVGENEEMVVHQPEPLRMVQSPPESNPSPVSVESKEPVGIIRNGKFKALEELQQPETVIINVAEIDSYQIGPDKYLYTIKDSEGVGYSTFSSTIYAQAEESRVTGKRVAMKFKRTPGKAGTKYEGKVFLNIVEVEYVALDAPAK